MHRRTEQQCLNKAIYPYGMNGINYALYILHFYQNSFI
ncbi:putative membrane protein [Acinetobacter baumannii 1437282]|nr:putative membrane protein [Acinetobacter baumannii 1437282]